MSAGLSQELKGLQSQLARARAEAYAIRMDLDLLTQKYAAAYKVVASLEDRIRALQESSAQPIISEHALLRWLERVNGIDMEALKVSILDGGTEAAIKFAKSGKVVKNGHTLIFKNNTVVTVE